MKRSIYIGYDPRHTDAFAVSRYSIESHLPISAHVEVMGLRLRSLQEMGLYWRKHRIVDGQLYDEVSQAPMSTEFSISRFLVPTVARSGWALFVDGDILARCDVSKIFDCADDRYAVQVVKHNYAPSMPTKMDNKLQTAYLRKNWSSVMLFNCEHKETRTLTPDIVNIVRGLDLHQFNWTNNIGELDPPWNWLVGHSAPEIEPKIVHFTDGVPSMPGYHDVPYADEWRNVLHEWAR